MQAKPKIPRTEDRPSIALVGLMGTGKTTIGRKLAAQIALPFVDADDEIEQAAGMKISEIFERLGEPSFRDGERRVLQRLIGDGPCVISTGGGAFIDRETRAALLKKAVVVWLDADIGTLVERVSRRGNRPLLTGRDPETVLRELAETRRPAYAQAHYRIDSSVGAAHETVDEILRTLTEAGVLC